ncbi:MAG: hypothetical protein H7842_13695 [Gammaproteobacteria bacterium SHHR-1]|uniref:hypothetical protein n=1 Tax=Magnetovirga frankeli TaxID=947516 RepID=UPI001293DFFB|nr:hypothetical protein D5125_02950 [gamma proteobacterium SS-5]
MHQTNLMAALVLGTSLALLGTAEAAGKGGGYGGGNGQGQGQMKRQGQGSGQGAGQGQQSRSQTRDPSLGGQGAQRSRDQSGGWSSAVPSSY